MRVRVGVGVCVCVCVCPQDVFNPKLSDRRSEGNSFIPPDTSAEYVDRLRHLLKAHWPHPTQELGIDTGEDCYQSETPKWP